MAELGRLSPWEQERLEAMEQQLRSNAPALDRALTRGVLRGLSDPPRDLRSRSGWPVVVLVVLGSLLVVLGLGAPDVLVLVTGTYVVALSFLGLWLPRRGRADRHCTGRSR